MSHGPLARAHAEANPPTSEPSPDPRNEHKKPPVRRQQRLRHLLGKAHLAASWQESDKTRHATLCAALGPSEKPEAHDPRPAMTVRPMPPTLLPLSLSSSPSSLDLSLIAGLRPTRSCALQARRAPAKKGCPAGPHVHRARAPHTNPVQIACRTPALPHEWCVGHSWGWGSSSDNRATSRSTNASFAARCTWLFVSSTLEHALASSAERPPAKVDAGYAGD